MLIVAFDQWWNLYFLAFDTSNYVFCRPRSKGTYVCLHGDGNMTMHRLSVLRFSLYVAHKLTTDISNVLTMFTHCFERLTLDVCMLALFSLNEYAYTTR